MTNKDKFLRDNVSEREFVNEYADYYTIETVKRPVVIRENLMAFLNEQVKPTLTEDERVILRNIPTEYWQKICRDNYGVLEIRGEYEKIDFHTDNISDFDEYNHLFLFIKERRRI